MHTPSHKCAHPNVTVNTHSFNNWLQGYYLLILEVSNQFSITELKSRCWHDLFPQKLRGESGSCSFGCWQSLVPSLGSGACFFFAGWKPKDVTSVPSAGVPTTIFEVSSKGETIKSFIWHLWLSWGQFSDFRASCNRQMIQENLPPGPSTSNM